MEPHFNKSAKPLATAQALPLGAEEFVALMGRFYPFPAPMRIAVAVSGGADSMALVFCARRWLDAMRDPNEILALIVDHGLREESAREAADTEQALAALGIDAEILRWQHPPVVSRLHENARRARYKLLTDACRAHRITNLLLAHHREDQAETILMRLAKGSGIDGLAGMAAETTIDGVRILRPCLGIPKQRLVTTCDAEAISYASDPSNQSQKYARGRLRRILPLLSIEGLTVDRLNDLGQRAAEAKAALDHAAEALLRVATQRDEAGTIKINLEQLRSAPRAIALRALNTCLCAIHAEDYAAEYVSLSRLLDALCAEDDMPACTLQGCLIVKLETHATIMREYAGITEEPVIARGTTVLWDQRWQVSLSAEAGADFVIRPLGNPPHEILDRLAPGLRQKMAQGRVRATLPSLWYDGALALIPAFPGLRYESSAAAHLNAAGPPRIK